MGRSGPRSPSGVVADRFARERFGFVAVGSAVSVTLALLRSSGWVASVRRASSSRHAMTTPPPIVIPIASCHHQPEPGRHAARSLTDGQRCCQPNDGACPFGDRRSTFAAAKMRVQRTGNHWRRFIDRRPAPPGRRCRSGGSRSPRSGSHRASVVLRAKSLTDGQHPRWQGWHAARPWLRRPGRDSA